MKVIQKQPGGNLPEYSIDGTDIIVEGVAIDTAARQQDGAVLVEIRVQEGEAVEAVEGGVGDYLAQIDIPARRYVEEDGPLDEDGRPTTIRTPVPIDPNRVTVTLWPQKQ